MNVLLDTNVVLWAAATPERLGSATSLVRDAPRRLVSAASVWELAIKQHLGKLTLGGDVRSWVARAVRELSLDRLDITFAHAAAVEHLPDVHRDPFDRLLVAQARSEGVVLLTGDEQLLGYGEPVRLIG